MRHAGLTVLRRLWAIISKPCQIWGPLPLSHARLLRRGVATKPAVTGTEVLYAESAAAGLDQQLKTLSRYTSMRELQVTVKMNSPGGFRSGAEAAESLRGVCSSARHRPG